MDNPRVLLKRYNLSPRKSLGQNFLADHNALLKIVRDSGVDLEDEVLEIGAGIGSLTRVLATNVKKVVAVEIDQHLFPVLKAVTQPFPNIQLVQGDILKIPITDLFEKSGYKVVCSEPSAALCLQDELSLLIDSEDAKAVSANTYELMSYLGGLQKAGKLKSGRLDGKDEFAYHMPCHLCALGVSGASIELLGKVEGIAINDINAGCCGLAGTFGMQKKNYELSEQIGDGIAAALKESDVETVLTECSACRMQIEHLTGKKAIHPIKILAKIYGLM